MRLFQYQATEFLTSSNKYPITKLEALMNRTADSCHRSQTSASSCESMLSTDFSVNTEITDPASIHASRKAWMKHPLKALLEQGTFLSWVLRVTASPLGHKGTKPGLFWSHVKSPPLQHHCSPFTTPPSFTPEHSHGQMFITLVSPSNYFAGVVGVASGRSLSTHTNTGLGCCVFGQIIKCN